LISAFPEIGGIRREKKKADRGGGWDTESKPSAGTRTRRELNWGRDRSSEHLKKETAGKEAPLSGRVRNPFT